MTRETFSKFDAADYLRDEDIAAFLNAAAAEDDPATGCTPPLIALIARLPRLSSPGGD